MAKSFITSLLPTPAGYSLRPECARIGTSAELCPACLCALCGNSRELSKNCPFLLAMATDDDALKPIECADVASGVQRLPRRLLASGPPWRPFTPPFGEQPIGVGLLRRDVQPPAHS